MNSIKALIHEASTKLTKVGKCRLDIYITVIVISTACALLFSYGIPNEYAAQAKISDEYKTTDLLVGLNSANVLLRDLNVNHGNEGTDDIEIYSKVLKSEDFINEIAHVFIPKYNQNYLDYLANNYKRPLWERPFYRHNPSAKGHEQEIKEIIKNNIRYNFSTNPQTLEIQVKDQNPQVAAVVLEQTLSHLKSNIERLRTHRAIIDKENAATKRKEASLEYQKAKRNYDNFADSHKKISSDYIASRLVRIYQS